MATVTIYSDFGARENKICHYFHFSPSICHEIMKPDAMILVFWTLNFKSAFSVSSLTLIERLFSSSSHSIFRVVSSAFLRLLIFLLAIWFLACDSSSPAYHVMCFPGSSAGKESTCNVGDLGLIPVLGISSGGRHGNPL